MDPLNLDKLGWQEGSPFYLDVEHKGYDSSGNEGTLRQGFAFQPYSNNMNKYNVLPGSRGTALYLGSMDPGGDPSKLLGQGKAINPEYAQYAQFLGIEIGSAGGVKAASRAQPLVSQWVDKARAKQADNPWGTGPDAAAAALAFEKRLLANDEASLREMTDLQTRKYGAFYARSGDVREIQRLTGYSGGDAGREPNYTRVKEQMYEFIAPKGISATEEYMLRRYEQRNIETGRAVGSGYDAGYNPLGLAEDDRFQPGEFMQEEADFAPTRVADRSSRQSGKATLTETSNAKSVQL